MHVWSVRSNIVVDYCTTTTTRVVRTDVLVWNSEKVVEFALCNLLPVVMLWCRFVANSWNVLQWNEMVAVSTCLLGLFLCGSFFGVGENEIVVGLLVGCQVLRSFFWLGFWTCRFHFTATPAILLQAMYNMMLACLGSFGLLAGKWKC